MARISFSSHFAIVLIGTLFALPFVGIGSVMLYLAHLPVAEHFRTRNWSETPARIVEMDRVGATYVTRYEYNIAGQSMIGTWVLKADDGSVGFVDEDRWEEVRRLFKAQKPISCFVDLRNPGESVLFRAPSWRRLALLSVFSASFGGFGAGLLTALFVGWRIAPVTVANVPENEPWRSRSDWLAGQIRPQLSARTAAYGLGALAAWWWLSTGVLALYLPYYLVVESSRWVWLTTIVPVVGVALCVAAGYQAARHRKYGDSYFEISGLTGVVGGPLAGVIYIPTILPLGTSEFGGVRLRLVCLEVKHKGDRSMVIRLWEDEQLVDKPIVDVDNVRTVVPVLFAIPYDALESAVQRSKRHILWELTASVVMPGIDFKSTYIVPVFKTSESRSDFCVDERLARDIAPVPDRGPLFRESRIYTESDACGGVRITIPMARNWNVALILTFVVSIFSIGLWLSIRSDDWLMTCVLAPFALVFAWLAVDLWFFKSIIDASSAGLTVRGGLFGFGRRFRIRSGDIQCFASNEPRLFRNREFGWSIVVETSDHGRVTLAKGIHSKLLERAIIDELKSALGPTGVHD